MAEVEARTGVPRISVVVPACEAARTLAACLHALRASTLSRDLWELIVVDDASADGSARIAATCADVVVPLPGMPRGPAYARNRGAEACRGEILVFVDPDVAVAPEALERLLGAFDADPRLSAACGSWVADPGGGMVAGYHAVCRIFEQRAGPAPQFWAGLGAIRARVFAEVGPFDEWLYPRASVEDTELAHRLHLAGFQTARLHDVRATGLDSTRLRTILWEDVKARVMPATRLALHVGGRNTGLGLARTFLAGTFALLVIVAVLLSPFRDGGGPAWVAGVGVVGLILTDRSLLRFAARTRGPLFTLATLPLHAGAATTRAAGACVGWCAHHLVGPPRVPIEIYARSADADTSPMWPPPPVQPTSSVWARPPVRSARRSRRAAA